MDLKQELEKHLPIIFELLENSPFSPKQWATINQKYANTYERRIQSWHIDSTLKFDSCLYDIVKKYQKKERGAYRFIDLLRRTLEELSDLLPPQDRPKLKKTIHSLLIENDKAFLNYLGELLVLNNTLRDKRYSLIKIESKISSRTSADFELISQKTSETEFVEVVNLHIDDNKKELARFITSKLQKKYELKTKNEETFRKFTIVPVVWASYKLLRTIENLYLTGQMKVLPYSLPVCAFASYEEPGTNKYLLKFGTVTTMFKGLNIRE